MEAKLDSLQTILAAVMFIVPGYLTHSVFSFFTIRRTETKELLYLRFVAFSVFNLSICSPWIMKMILIPAFMRLHPWITMRYLLGVIFVSPLSLGLMASILDNAQILNRIARKFGLSPMHPIPSAWDHRFNELGRESPRFVIVTFKDGKELRGMYGAGAVASSDQTERDIYLKSVHVPVGSSNGQITYQLQPQSDGILVVGSEIRAIEFLCPSQPEAVRRSRAKEWLSTIWRRRFTKSPRLPAQVDPTINANGVNTKESSNDLGSETDQHARNNSPDDGTTA